MRNIIKKLLAVLLCGTVVLVLFSGCKSSKDGILNAYNSEDGNDFFYTFKATISEIRQASHSDSELDRYYSLDIDYEYFEQQYGTDDKILDSGRNRWESNYIYLNMHEFQLISANYNILKENGGFELLEEGAEVIISSHSYYPHNGWKFPILGLSIGDTTYLEFETGKENFLNYVRADFKDPE